MSWPDTTVCGVWLLRRGGRWGQEAFGAVEDSLDYNHLMI